MKFPGLSVIAAGYKLTHMNMKYKLSPNIYIGSISILFSGRSIKEANLIQKLVKDEALFKYALLYLYMSLTSLI